jgi:SulP family sulfate permease
MTRFLPFMSWLPGYRKADLSSDLNAGLIVAVMLVPQGMAYAMLAGLPPVIGLYASVVPLLLYAAFGSSRQLAVGPVAMVSLLVATAIGSMAPGASDAERIALAVMLSVLVGVIQLGMGLLRLGYLVNFLSHPVISGFTSAAALIIGFSQLKHLLGVPIPRGHHVHHILAEALRHADQIQPHTVAIGAVSIGALLALKRWAPRLPGALLVVSAATAVVWLLGLHERGVAIVGQVPAGLPGLRVPTLDGQALRQLLPMAVTISLVGFMESVSVAKVFANRHGYRLDADRELIGLGVANLGGALSGAYPVTGGFSRSAVNDQAGARTPMAGVITAAMVALALMFLTPLFHFLPKATLAAIIMVAVFGLIDVAEVRRLWRIKRSDLVLLLLTFAATLSLGIEAGILSGVGASMLLFVALRTRPHFAELGRLDGTHTYRNLRHHPDAKTVPGVLALRFDAAFYFGNVSFLQDTLERLEDEMDTPLRAVILDAGGINDLDSTAEHALHELLIRYRERGVRMVLAGVKGPVRDVLRRSGLDRDLGDGGRTLTVHEAMCALDPGSAEDPDPAGTREAS